jgi:hypothetical protein
VPEKVLPSAQPNGQVNAIVLQTGIGKVLRLHLPVSSWQSVFENPAGG